MTLDYITIIDYLGTFAFAISGIRMAATRRFDWFGAYVVGLITAIGGGTTRDVLLDVTPFWMIQPSYLIVTGLALLFVIAFGKWVVKLNYTIFVFDAIGLGLFTVVGIDKAITYGYEEAWWIAIAMGMITGAVGGLIRDVLLNQVPLILRKDFYAMACIFGGLIYFACLWIGINEATTQTITLVSVIVIRILAVRFHIGLPVLGGEEFKEEES
ncbi:MAG TPA: trimeric intracellular cation channel family protein [Bacteroidales bacterium]|nr:trimeric intracellular cation channel family protein [Bacteroidales bacterium]